MPVRTSRFEVKAREMRVMPTSLKKIVPQGVIRFAEARHSDDPEHTVNGIVMPGWKTMWFMDRNGADYYGILWFHTNTSREGRFNTALNDAWQFVQDNIKVGRY